MQKTLTTQKTACVAARSDSDSRVTETVAGNSAGPRCNDGVLDDRLRSSAQRGTLPAAPGRLLPPSRGWL